jgi:hypothetical protein
MSYHQPKKSLLAILRVANELGGTPDRFEVHRAAHIYKEVDSTVQRLIELHRLGLLHRQSTGKEFVYFLTLKGKQLLRLSFSEQCDSLSRSAARADIPERCIRCGATAGLTWYRKAYYCERHLNEDNPTQYNPPRMSALGWT